MRDGVPGRVPGGSAALWDTLTGWGLEEVEPEDLSRCCALCYTGSEHLQLIHKLPVVVEGTMHLPNDNNPTDIADRHFTLRCPHCDTKSGVSLVSPPRWEFLRRFQPEWVGMGYRCDACNHPVFLKFRLTGWGNSIGISDQPVEIERPTETFEYKYLPDRVASDFREALTCYSASCWNAFAAMCRRTLQTSAESLGAEGTAKVKQQLEHLRDLGAVDEEAFGQLSTIMLVGHDGAHPHLPPLSPERAGILLELIKDSLYQLFVRKAKIEEAVRLRAAAIAAKKQ